MSLQCFKVDGTRPLKVIKDDDLHCNVHITQFSLFQGPKNIPVEIFLQKKGSQKFLVGTLENPLQRQFQARIFMEKHNEVEISIKTANGKPATVHMLGYSEPDEPEDNDNENPEEMMTSAEYEEYLQMHDLKQQEEGGSDSSEETNQMDEEDTEEQEMPAISKGKRKAEEILIAPPSKKQKKVEPVAPAAADIESDSSDSDDDSSSESG
eukprot:254474_1